MKSNTVDIKKITLTSLFLALCSTLVILQIPVYLFLNVDFSLVALLLAIRFVGYRNSFLIALIYPWFAMFSYLPADLVAVAILITLAVLVICFDFIFKKIIKNEYAAAASIILVTTITITLLNVFLFTPMYYDFNYELIFKQFWYWFFMYLGFNSIKLSICYFSEIIIYKGIKKELA